MRTFLTRLAVALALLVGIAPAGAQSVSTPAGKTLRASLTPRSGPSTDLMTFGDSITEAEQAAGAVVANRPGGLFMSLAGTGEIMTALAQAGWPLRYDAWNDPAGTQPSLLGNGQKYYRGGNFSQAGATISAISDQIDYAKASGFVPGAIILGGGTNSLPLDQAAHLALIDKVLAYWPTVPIGVQNVRPPTSAASGTGNRSSANVQDANTKIAQNVAARASAGGGVSLIDVYTSYANRGSGGFGQTGDYLDGLHPSIQGASAASPAEAAWLRSKVAAVDRSEAGKIASVLPASAVAFTGAPYTVNVAAGASPNAGTITGSMPTGMSISKVGSVNSNITTSIIDRGDGTKAIRLTVAKVAGNATEKVYIYDTAINANTAPALASNWFESVVTTADDRNAGWVSALVAWLERSNTAGNTVNANYGFAQTDGAAITVGSGPLTAQSGARVMKLLAPPKRGEGSSTGSQRQLIVTFNPSAGDTMTMDIQLWDIRTRLAPQGAPGPAGYAPRPQ